MVWYVFKWIVGTAIVMVIVWAFLALGKAYHAIGVEGFAFQVLAEVVPNLSVILMLGMLFGLGLGIANYKDKQHRAQ